MNNESTICAIATSPGVGAISIIRLSGNDAIAIANSIYKSPGEKKKLINQKANTIHFGSIVNNEEIIDEVLISIFKAPYSYTGEDVVEISCHGSFYIQQKILEILISAGAILAKPGEFTQRAFLNGKLDLSQAEGVADLISSSSAASHRLAINQIRGGFSDEIKKLRNELLDFISLLELELDFSEEDVEFADRNKFITLVEKIDSMIDLLIHSFEYGNAIKKGMPVAIIGPTNSGKSTLLNQLLREERAIVSDIAGTTRDFIEDTIILDGIQFRFIDTAGLRHAADQIETAGIARTHQKFEQADAVIILVDIADDPESINKSMEFIRTAETKNKHLIFALNKVDKYSSDFVGAQAVKYKKKWSEHDHVITISAKNNIGIESLEKLLVSFVMKQSPGENEVVVTNVRHFEALQRSSEALKRAKEGLLNDLPGDLLAMDIREVLHYLGEITGEITNDEILGNIFKNFCIGK